MKIKLFINYGDGPIKKTLHDIAKIEKCNNGIISFVSNENIEVFHIDKNKTNDFYWEVTF